MWVLAEMPFGKIIWIKGLSIRDKPIFLIMMKRQ